jgi:hypothetical protein
MSDPERMARARAPAERPIAPRKLEIAIEEIDRVIALGARFGCVLAHSGYESSAVSSGRSVASASRTATNSA